eukprot:gene2605-2848_t
MVSGCFRTLLLLLPAVLVVLLSIGAFYFHHSWTTVINLHTILDLIQSSEQWMSETVTQTSGLVENMVIHMVFVGSDRWVEKEVLAEGVLGVVLTSAPSDVPVTLNLLHAGQDSLLDDPYAERLLRGSKCGGNCLDIALVLLPPSAIAPASKPNVIAANSSEEAKQRLAVILQEVPPLTSSLRNRLHVSLTRLVNQPTASLVFWLVTNQRQVMLDRLWSHLNQLVESISLLEDEYWLRLSLEMVQEAVIEVEAVSRQRSLSSQWQIAFVLYGPFWVPMAIPLFRLLRSTQIS